MYFIMIIISFVSGGIIPAPPSLAVVLLYMAFLKEISEAIKKKQAEDESNQQGSGSGTGGDSGNVL